jgi:sugar lactone lactonase YvrE
MCKKKYFMFWGIFLFLSAAMMLPAVVGKALKVYPTPGQHPTGMTFDGRLIWLADTMTARLYGLNPDSGKVEKTLEAPGYDPRGLAWDGQWLWCVDGGEAAIYGLDVETGVAEKILESYTPKPGGLAFDGSFLWLLDNDNHQILKINRSDGMMHEHVPAPAKWVHGLTFDGRQLWTADQGPDMLYRVDPRTGEVTVRIPANGPFPYGLCWDGRTLWNADYQKTELYKLDLTDKEFMRRKDPGRYRWTICQEFRNFGPAEAQDVDIYIAVPRALDNQEILGDIVYDPQPAGFVTDRWDQKFARFHFDRVGAAGFLRVTLKLEARQYQTEYFIFPERVGSLKDIPKNLGKYLADGEKFDINNPLIQEAVKKVVGEERHPYRIMRRIFDFIRGKLEYNLKPVGGWNPAPTVLERGTGSCSEYTFLLIAMCRAAGLPARYSGSLVIRSKDKGFDRVWHRWAQVYLPNYGWLPVDVQAGDKELPADQTRYIGSLSNRFLITTNGGGDSEYLDFYYNFNSRWKTAGKCRIETQQYGEFIPLDDDE